MSLKSVALTGSLTLLLVACGMASGSRIDYSRTRTNYDNVTGSYNGPIMVEVLGNPFQQDKSAFAQDVAENMNMANAGGPAFFTPIIPAQPTVTTTGVSTPTGDVTTSVSADIPATEAPRGEPYVRLAFGGTDVSGICTDSGPMIEQTAGRGDVVAAFCSQGRTLSYVKGSMARIENSQDPAFGAFVGELTRELFPRYKFENAEPEFGFNRGREFNRGQEQN